MGWQCLDWNSKGGKEEDGSEGVAASRLWSIPTHARRDKSWCVFALPGQRLPQNNEFPSDPKQDHSCVITGRINKAQKDRGGNLRC